MAVADLAPMLEITGRLLVTQTTNESRLAVAAGSSTDLVAISAVLDRRTCAFCRGINGKVFRADSADAAMYTPPFHINDRCIWTVIGQDEVGALDYFDPQDKELQQLAARHAHFLTNPELYTPLDIPASPGSRDFVVRTVKDASGNRVTELDWKRPRYDLKLTPSPTTGLTPVETGRTDTGQGWDVLGGLPRLPRLKLELPGTAPAENLGPVIPDGGSFLPPLPKKGR